MIEFQCFEIIVQTLTHEYSGRGAHTQNQCLGLTQ